MKKIVATLVATLLVTAAFAEGNVEKARRFRAQQTDNATVQTAAATINAVSQKDAPGTRYALAHSNAAQLEELGSRYALAHSNAAQLEELGSRYALAHSNAAQLEELGSRYALAHSNAAQTDEASGQ